MSGSACRPMAIFCEVDQESLANKSKSPITCSISFELCKIWECRYGDLLRGQESAGQQVQESSVMLSLLKVGCNLWGYIKQLSVIDTSLIRFHDG